MTVCDLPQDRLPQDPAILGAAQQPPAPIGSQAPGQAPGYFPPGQQQKQPVSFYQFGLNIYKKNISSVDPNRQCLLLHLPMNPCSIIKIDEIVERYVSFVKWLIFSGIIRSNKICIFEKVPFFSLFLFTNIFISYLTRKKL